MSAALEPWESLWNSNYDRWEICEAKKGGRILFHSTIPREWGQDKTNRNHALIAAAAPELLAALIEVVRISDRKHDAWDAARAAIAKAVQS